MTSRSRPVALVLSALLGLAALNAFLAVRGNPVRAPGPDAPAPGPAGTVADHIAGNASCGGRACHGGLEANADLAKHLGQNEFTTWVGHDRHAHAYRVLHSERARRMARNLAAINEGGKEIPAHEDPRCLACHATPQLAELPKSERRDNLLMDGVGCEACHGAAGGQAGWLRTHMSPEFAAVRGKPKEQAELYKKHGMTHMQDVQVQARVCVGCHVGAPADTEGGTPRRDVYHDLMAAGHPRLTFELTAYLDNMPPHWRREQYKNDPTREVRSWAVGQVTTARASLDLLQNRTERAEAGEEKWPTFLAGGYKAPWPEFAEYDCFSCHADLQHPSWRREAAFPARRAADKDYVPGSLPYSRWSWAMLPYVTPTPNQPAVVNLQTLGKTMGRPYPDTKTVRGEATAARAALTALEKSVLETNYNEATVKTILKNLAGDPSKDEAEVKAMTWEEVQQFVLAVYALRAQLSDDARAQLDKVARMIAYPVKEELRFESPAEFRRDPKLNEELIKLRQALR
jgi:hypothetical protein